MRHWSVITLGLLLLGLSVSWQARPATAMADDGCVTLFDEKSLANWDTIGDANWRLEDGAVVADKGEGFLVSNTEYGDFQIRVEFYAEADTNSGVFIRCSRATELDSKVCYEVNIWDARP